MNDPHGITVRNHGYEVFFQHVPERTSWAPNCHWGHATGRDLLSLREQPIAITPGQGDDGIWTGCIVEDGGTAHAFYTAVSTPDFGIGRVRVAQPNDAAWSSWSKGEVVVEAPPELNLVAFRDPFVRRIGDYWRMFVGAADTHGTAMALTYTSNDLVSWQYDGIALSRNTEKHEPVWMGALWECPQIFDLDDHSIMLSSIWDADVLHYAAYALGSCEKGRFSANNWGRLTWGSSFYAPSLFTDSDGRESVMFWLRGVAGDGWAGALSIPYLLTVNNGRLVASPHPDLDARRTKELADGTVPHLAADIEWAADAGSLDISSGSLTLASFTRNGDQMVFTTPSSEDTFPAAENVRIVVDGPILEVSSSAGLFATVVAPQGSSLKVTATEGILKVFSLQ